MLALISNFLQSFRIFSMVFISSKSSLPPDAWLTLPPVSLSYRRPNYRCIFLSINFVYRSCRILSGVHFWMRKLLITLNLCSFPAKVIWLFFSDISSQLLTISLMRLIFGKFESSERRSSTSMIILWSKNCICKNISPADLFIPSIFFKPLLFDEIGFGFKPK